MVRGLHGPVFVGPELDHSVRVALTEAGIEVVGDLGFCESPRVAITIDPTVIPPTVEWVHCPFMGVDSLLGHLPATVQVLTRTTVGMPERIGSYTSTAVAAERWGFHTYYQRQSQHLWEQTILGGLPDPSDSSAVQDLSAVILGTGWVGSAVAQGIRTQFGDLVGVSLSGESKPFFDRVLPFNKAPWEEADCVIGAVPLTPHTSKILGEQVFLRLTGAHLVLVGRGATVDFDALRVALDQGQVRHATIDVYPVEPIPDGEWLWDHPHLTLTPHISGLTIPSDIVSAFLAVRDDLLAGRTPDVLVNFRRGY
ncbi:MAG: hypothetical protein LBG99_01580 [Propionibacteriaceae bacterium]|nr:hypothetical protein [Propionibacteriaceae bacterium]